MKLSSTSTLAVIFSLSLSAFALPRNQTDIETDLDKRQQMYNGIVCTTL